MTLANRMEVLGTETAFEVFAKAKALEAQGKDVVHLHIGAPDFETPPNVVEAGRKALADAITYNSMIDVYARAKRPLDAARVLEEMRLAGLKPGRVAHTALMKAHVEAGDLDAAESCLEDLEADYEAVLARTRELAAAGDLHASLAALERRGQRSGPAVASWSGELDGDGLLSSPPTVVEADALDPTIDWARGCPLIHVHVH